MVPTPSAPVAKPELTPPLAAMSEQLKKVTRGSRLECYALVGSTKHRCEESYRPWTKELEPILRAVRNSAPPFDTELATKLAHVLLCDEHRTHENHVVPLRHALSTSHRTPKALLEKGSRDGSDAPRPGKTLLKSLDCGSSRRARAKSAEPSIETPPTLPDTNPVNSIDIRWELSNKGTIHCIAYDTVSGRCDHELHWRRLENARKIISGGPGNETSDEAESDGTYQDSGQEEKISPRKLRRLLRYLLCSHHRQWFWVEFYLSRWLPHFESGYASAGSSEFWEDSWPDTDEGYGDVIVQCSSDPSDTEPTLIGDTLVGSASPPRRGAKASTGSTCAPTKLPKTPKRPTGSLSRKAHTDPGRASRSSKGRPPSPCRPRTPSISVSRAVSPSSLPPSPGLQLRRSPRLAARAASSRRDVRDSSPRASADDEETHLTGSLRKLSLSAKGTILTDAWSLGTGMSLKDEMMKPLKKSENTGCIYVIVSESSHPGWVKVGKSIKPDERREQLTNSCELDRVTMQKFENVEQHDRVEALVHRHLKCFKELMPCIHAEGLKVHREWFRCDPELARRVVEVWVKWMARKPYNYNVLRECWSERVESLSLGVGKGQQETFEELFQRHKRWTQQQLTP